MDEEFKVQIGVEVDESSAQTAGQRIRNIGKGTKAKIDIGVNGQGEINNANN